MRALAGLGLVFAAIGCYATLTSADAAAVLCWGFVWFLLVAMALGSDEKPSGYHHPHDEVTVHPRRHGAEWKGWGR